MSATLDVVPGTHAGVVRLVESDDATGVVTRNQIASLTPQQAEELALDLLSATYLVREHKKTRMKPQLRAQLQELLEGVKDK